MSVGSLDLDAVRAVWYRSPEAYRMPPELSPAEAHHARVEAKYGLGGVLASLPVLWCNHPSRVADAYKPVQLTRAALAGLAVPDTLLTNEILAGWPGDGNEQRRVEPLPPTEVGQAATSTVRP